MLKNSDKVDDYITYWLPLIKKCPEFQKIREKNLEKFFENFKNIILNIDILGVSVFDNNHTLRFSASTERDVKRKFEYTHKTQRVVKIYNRIMRHSNILQKMSSIERYISTQNRNTEPYYKLEECIKNRTIPFLKNISLNSNIALP